MHLASISQQDHAAIVNYAHRKKYCLTTIDRGRRQQLKKNRALSLQDISHVSEY